MGAAETNPAQVYEDFFVPGMFARWAPILVDRAGIGEGERVLDVACGTGIVAREAAKRVGPSGEVVGADISPHMLQVAQEVAASSPAPMRWVQTGADSLPDGPFDAVLCQQGLQFFPDRAAAAGEMRRVLAPGGRAAIAVWCGLDRHELFDALIRAEARHLDAPLEALATPFSFGDPDRLRATLTEAGFSDVEVEEVTHGVSFPSATRWVGMTMMAAAAVMPELLEMPDDQRAEIVEALTADISDTLDRYTVGDTVEMPLTANLALARP
ncbi:MAG TPA: methyltransferase domain-containing protein [Actinomycetota bacterium]|nr:methyltransferase domain-containing protein [Actinomycetota bacterium]